MDAETNGCCQTIEALSMQLQYMIRHQAKVAALHWCQQACLEREAEEETERSRGTDTDTDTDTVG